MLCLNKLPRLMIYLLPVLFAVPFLCSSGSASAISYSFNYDSVSNPIINNTTYDSTIVGFTPTFVSIEVSNYDSQGFYSPFNILMSQNGSYGVRLSNDSNGYSFGVFNLPANTMYYITNYFAGKTYNITLTFYDSNPLVSTPCPECPPVPDYPYSDILNKIYVAILAVSATALCIYFFYAFYNMFFGGIKK